jgi:2-haloacid dehalogenase
MMKPEVLTFDCYGTLIDWESGILAALRPILDNHGIRISDEKALELYGELESEAERGEYREYRTLLQIVLDGIGASLGFIPSPTELQHFAESVKDWPAFPDSAAALQLLHERYKLAIISNIDDDLFAYSAHKLQTQFDWVITAQQAKSYKPDVNNFLIAFDRIGVPKDKILHVAQSLYHDIVPAQALGLSTVWVNRRHAKEGAGATPVAAAKPDLEVPDLKTLAEILA